ncbi:MAG: sensor domain-containing diguanylate cyclase [Rectinemataceae bacterium]|jgi:diguanylate cyclase (GGDEF)-like protein/PAS domain S-box-containing protein
MVSPISADVLAQVIESISEGVYFLDRGGLITFWNNGAERITGFSRAEVVGTKCSDNLLRHTDEKGKELCIDGCPMAATMEDCRPRDGEVFLHHKKGHRVPIVVHAIPILGEDATALGAIEIFSDRSERSGLLTELQTLRKEVLTDALTGLGNRRYAALSAESAIREFEGEGTEFGILILDIDHFKLVNDKYGHTIGDRVLRMIGWTLANAVRRNDAAARWGGEEFVVVCPRLRLPVLAEVAERTRSLIERSWISLEDGRKIVSTVSVGGTMARRGDTLETLVARADERLYACKKAGRNRAEVGD